MTKTILAPLVLLFALSSVIVAQKIDPPTLTPTPATESQERLIKEGVALHDRGEYDAAIAKYEEVLRENPNNDLALYELAYSHHAKKDHRKTLETAYKGVRYKSEFLANFYVLIGNTLDDLGESQKAVEVYQFGINTNPQYQLLYYNLGLTYGRQNKVEEAKTQFKKALFMNPNHASSHGNLAVLFRKTGYRTPALLAAMRFLVLEPKSKRSASLYRAFWETLNAGVTAGKNPNEITIAVDVSDKKEEGDFGALEFSIGLLRGAPPTAKDKRSEVKRLSDHLNTILAMISDLERKEDKSKFTWRYYVPYFVELKKRNYVEPFTYYISQSSEMSGVSEWLEANADRVNEFLNWSNSYQWAKE